MGKISLWKQQPGKDFKFIDSNVAGLFTIGGTDVHVHKYVGPVIANPSSNGVSVGDLSQPTYTTNSVTNIQDLLFVETRDRNYDPSVYQLRCIYQMSDLDFDMTQFGLFLGNSSMMITFHQSEMVQRIGRRLIAGDVIELVHLKDFYSLDTTINTSIKRYFVVIDAVRSAEGFSMTWWPHLWRVRCEALPNSPEYQNLLLQVAGENGYNTTDPNLPNYVNNAAAINSTYVSTIAINDAVIAEAEFNTPTSGYNVDDYYTLAVDSANGNVLVNYLSNIDTSTVNVSTDTTVVLTDTEANFLLTTPSPTKSGYKVYLNGSGNPPNGLPAVTGTAFPSNASVGTYCLRIDYLPNRLFRFDGNIWRKVQDNVHTDLTPGVTNLNEIGTYINDPLTTTLQDGTVVPQMQALSKIFKNPKN